MDDEKKRRRVNISAAFMNCNGLTSGEAKELRRVNVALQHS